MFIQCRRRRNIGAAPLPVKDDRGSNRPQHAFRRVHHFLRDTHVTCLWILKHFVETEYRRVRHVHRVQAPEPFIVRPRRGRMPRRL